MSPPSNRARAILTALILSDTNSVKRSPLIISIWPESSPESRKVRFRQELANLRTFLENLGCPDALTVDRDEIRLDIRNLSIDFIDVSSAIDSFEADPNIHISRILPILANLGNTIPSPDFRELFERDQRRFINRVESTRMLAARILVDTYRHQDALRVLNDILDINPENQVAITLRDTALLKQVPKPMESALEPVLESTVNAPKHQSASRIPRFILFGLLITSILITYVLWVRLTSPAKPTISMLSINTIKLYEDKPYSGELPNSEGTSVFNANGYMAVSGFTRTRMDDVDGLTLLLDSSGKLLWRKRYGSASRDCDRFFQVTQDASGNVFSAGESYLTKPEVPVDGWYGRAVSYTRDGTLRFATRTKQPVSNSNGVVRIVAKNDGHCWLYTTTLHKNRYYIMVSHFDAKGVLLSERKLDSCAALLSDVRVASNGSQYVFGTAEIASGTAAHRDWYAVKLNAEGNTIWSEHLDGPAPGNTDDERCTGILDAKDAVMLYGVMDWPSTSNTRTKHSFPTIAKLDEITGNVVKLTKIPTSMSSPLVRCWDMYARTQILMILIPLRDTGARNIEWYLLHKVSGEIEQQGTFSLPNNLTAINTLNGEVSSDGHVAISLSVGPNRAGALPTSIVRASTDATGKAHLEILENTGTMKLTGQTNGNVVGQIERTANNAAMIVTNLNAGTRQQ